MTVSGRARVVLPHLGGGIGTREAGQPASDRDRLDPWQGQDEGWLWRRGFDVGFRGRDAAEDLAAFSYLKEETGAGRNRSYQEPKSRGPP